MYFLTIYWPAQRHLQIRSTLMWFCKVVPDMYECSPFWLLGKAHWQVEIDNTQDLRSWLCSDYESLSETEMSTGSAFLVPPFIVCVDSDLEGFWAAPGLGFSSVHTSYQWCDSPQPLGWARGGELWLILSLVSEDLNDAISAKRMVARWEDIWSLWHKRTWAYMTNSWVPGTSSGYFLRVGVRKMEM